MKNNTIIIGIVLLLLIAGGIYIRHQVPKKVVDSKKITQQPLLNSKAQYDEIELRREITDPDKLAQLSPSTSETLGHNIFQTWMSKQVTVFSVPLVPVSGSSVLEKGEIKGMQIGNGSFYIYLFHLIKLDDSKVFCDNLQKKNINTGSQPKKIQILDTKYGKATEWNLTSTLNTEVIEVNQCIEDTQTKAWIIDMYFDKAEYEGTFKKITVDMMNSFSFSD